MSRWRDTSTIPENEDTFLEDEGYYEKPSTFDLEFDEYTDLQELEDETWEESRKILILKRRESVSLMLQPIFWREWER